MRTTLPLTQAWPLCAAVACTLIVAQVYAMDSHYVNREDLPHWLSDEARLYMEKQSYRPAISLDEYKAMTKEALKREPVKKFVNNPLGRGVFSIGSAIANDDIEYTHKFIKQGESLVERQERELAEGRKTLKVGIHDATGINDTPELKARYTVEDLARDKHWGVEANANSNDTNIRVRWGFNF